MTSEPAVAISDDDRSNALTITAYATYYDIATHRLDEQSKRVDALDTKTAVLFAFATGVLGILGILVGTTAMPRIGHVHTVFVLLLSLGFVIYALLLLCLLGAFRVRDWEWPPDMIEFETHCTEYSDAGMREWIANACIQAIESNEPKLARKASFLARSLVCLGLEALALSSAALLAIWTR